MPSAYTVDRDRVVDNAFIPLGVLQARIYILNADTNELVEYDWNSTNMYTFNNNPYAVPTVYTDVANAAAGMDALASTATVVVFGSSSTTGQGGLGEFVGETTHASDATQGSQVSFASVAWGDAALNMVFYTDDSGHVRTSVEVLVETTPTWFENEKVRVQDGSDNDHHDHCRRGPGNERRC